MKKSLVFVAIIGFIMIAICACGEKKITVVGADGKEYESYQECCAAQDFQAAHQFLAKMQNAVLNMEKGDDRDNAAQAYLIAHENVFKQEALFLMSQGDDAAKQRLVYLLKEEGGNNSHVSMLIDLAIENDDEAFVKVLANQYSRNVGRENLKKLMNYLSSKDNLENNVFLKDLFNKLGEDNLLLELAIQNNDKIFVREYASTHLSFYNSTLLNYLAGTKDKKDSEMILGLLAQEEKSISKRPSNGTFVQYSCYDLNKECEQYVKDIKTYNSKCIELLDVAINAGNRVLASRIISKMKSNLTYNYMQNSVQKRVNEEKWYGKVSNVESWDKIIIKGSNDRDDITNANARLNQAVKNGVFK